MPLHDWGRLTRNDAIAGVVRGVALAVMRLELVQLVLHISLLSLQLLHLGVQIHHKFVYFHVSILLLLLFAATCWLILLSASNAVYLTEIRGVKLAKRL